MLLVIFVWNGSIYGEESFYEVLVVVYKEWVGIKKLKSINVSENSKLELEKRKFL